jgi:hypothetical protein
MGDIKTGCLIKNYTFGRCDGLINQLLLRNVFTSYLVMNTQGNLHTNTFFAYHVYKVLKKGANFFMLLLLLLLLLLSNLI